MKAIVALVFETTDEACVAELSALVVSFGRKLGRTLPAETSRPVFYVATEHTAMAVETLLDEATDE